MRRWPKDPAVDASRQSFRPRLGFVLILVLALLFSATLLMARMATHSIRLKSEAADAIERLQTDWAAGSTAHVMLPQCETMLTDINLRNEAESETPSTCRVQVAFPDRALTATVFDLDARLNLNTLLQIGGEPAVRTAIDRWLGDLPVNLRPHPSNEGQHAAFRTWADVIAVEQLEAHMSISDAVELASSQLTCWGFGQLHLRRCSDEQLLHLGRSIGRTGMMQQILRERRNSPDAALEALLQTLNLRSEDAQIARKYLSDSSGCWGLLIRSEPSGPTLFLVGSASSGAYRTRTQIFRLR